MGSHFAPEKTSHPIAFDLLRNQKFNAMQCYAMLLRHAAVERTSRGAPFQVHLPRRTSPGARPQVHLSRCTSRGCYYQRETVGTRQTIHDRTLSSAFWVQTTRLAATLVQSTLWLFQERT